VRKLSDLLISERVLTRAQVDEALEAQALYGGGLDTCLLELGLSDEPTLERLIGQCADTPNTVDARQEPPSIDALALFSPGDAARWRLVPFCIDGRVLDVVCAFPPDLRVLDEVSFKTNLRVRTSVTTELRVAVLIEQHYRVPRPARFSDLGRGAILRPHATGDDAFKPAVPASQDEDASMPSISMGDVIALDPSLRDLPEPAPPRAQAPAPAPAPTPAPAPVAAAPAPARAPAPAEFDVDVDEPPAKVPEYKPVAYSPERFDASLAEFEDDRGEPTGVRRINKQLRSVQTRDELPSLVFLLLASHVRRAALFSVARGMCTGWDANGGTVEPHRIRTMAFPLSHDSIFHEAAQGDVYVGKMQLTRVNEEFARRMGEPRVAHVIVTPIKIRDKVVMMLVCDCESERALEKAFTPVVDTADKLARTLVRIILDKKKAAG
jgi:type II secretion system (T2SS) protein E